MKNTHSFEKDNQVELGELGLSEEQLAELSRHGLSEQDLRKIIENPVNQVLWKGKYPSFMDQWELTLGRLYFCYKTLYQKANREDFKNTVLTAVAKEGLVFDNPLSIPYQLASAEDKERGYEWVLGNTPHAVIMIASAYLLRALRSTKEWKWANFSDATYWCGVAMMQSQSDNSSPDYEKLVRKEIAAKGAQARDKKYAPLRELALRLAKEKCPKVYGWPSRRQAVIAVKNEVLDEARKRNMPLSEDNALVTIDGWLAKMPEAEELFPKRTPKSAG